MSRFQLIKGMLFPNVNWSKKEFIEGSLEYVPKDGDIIIASYPKTGTTWLQYIVLQITSKGESFPSFNDINSKTLMELVGPECIDNLKGLRIYKHHYRYDMVKKNPKSKVLYIYRSPEDTLVSYFHFLGSVYKKQLSLENFFEEFLTGYIEYGSYFEHVLSYYSHKSSDNLLLISYEKLHANRKEGILEIAKFLGEEYYQNLSTNESLLNKILKNTSFEYMKTNLKFVHPQFKQTSSSEESEDQIILFRKGVIGDGKNLLTEEQLKQLRVKTVDAMKGTEIIKEWITE